LVDEFADIRVGMEDEEFYAVYVEGTVGKVVNRRVAAEKLELPLPEVWRAAEIRLERGLRGT
jgi:hypothetical protein